MKARKFVYWGLGILFCLYAAYVARFEAWLGYVQPQGERSIVITTFDAKGNSYDRVLSAFNMDGELYVGVNHWPRDWYFRILKNPNVRIRRNDETKDYVAEVLAGDEREKIAQAYTVPLSFRFQTGFPRREFVRLDAAGG